MSQFFGLAIESMVAVLLLLTILYCARLNSRIKLLKADERAMKATVAELMMASESAERSIAGLKLTVREAQETLSSKLRDADIFNLAMAENLKAGEDVLDRLRKIARANKLMADAEAGASGDDDAPAVLSAQPQPSSDTLSIAAAAHALAERTRARINSLAA